MSVTNSEISRQSSSQLNEFNAALRGLLKVNNPEARSLLAFIRRGLRQYRLHGRDSEIDILITAYLRGIEQLSNGKTIRNPMAWMRATVLNIIRENSRRYHREQLLVLETVDELIVDPSTVSWMDDFILNENKQAIEQAFQHLNKQEQELLDMKYLQGMTWKEVQAHLKETNVSVSTLRKRGQRILEKLQSVMKVDAMTD